MQRGERVVVEDVTTSPVFAGTAALDVVLAAGVRAVQSTPLLDLLRPARRHAVHLLP